MQVMARGRRGDRGHRCMTEALYFNEAHNRAAAAMPRVFDNDDGWILGAHAGAEPLTPEMIWEQSIGPR